MKKYVGGKLVTVGAKERAEIEAEWAKNEAEHAAERAKAETEEAERAEIAAAIGASDTSKIAILEAEVKALRKAITVIAPNLAEAAPLAAVEAIEKKRKGRKP
jgi:hypothetical protein